MIIKKRNEIENKKKETPQSEPEQKIEEKIDIFDLDNIEFSQRQERRRGNRRRGYRRIDDRNLISRAQEEAGAIRESAAKEGYNAGIEQAKGDIENVKKELEKFLSAKQEVFEFIAPDILEISIDIARKIIKKEVKQDPEMILSLIMDVLKTISKEEPKVTIKVNSAQFEIAKRNLPELVTSAGVDARVNIVSDDTIGEGSCVLQTKNGIVDATIDTQLEIIKEAFKGM